MATQATATDSDSVASHMMKLKMKMVQQKIQNEKDRIVNRPSSGESTGNDLENQARLQQAMLRRQELLDNIRREQLLNEQNKRPRTYSARRRYTPSPLPVPPSRRSLPDFAKYNLYNQGAETYRSRPDNMREVKHVIEHKIPQPQTNLPPINQQRAPPVIFQQPPPPAQVIPMQQPTPQIIAAPAAPHIIYGNPSPVIHNLGQPERKAGMFNKEDFMDMMLMQNAQLHQMIMQQALTSVPRVTDPLGAPRVNGAVHHHHYTTPPSQPAVTHYTTMPAMDIRGSVPYRERKKEQRTPFEEPRIIPIPVVKIRKQLPPPPPPPVYVPPPPPPPRIPVPIFVRRPKPVLIKRVPVVLPKKLVKKKSKQTFPGPEPLRRFRHVALAAAFIAHLRANVKKKLPNRPNSVFLFGIILKEIVAALHRIYLNPDGNIYPVLNDIIGPNCYDLAQLVHGGHIDTKEESVLIQELQYVIENLVYHITEIMPSTGVLGTHRKSAVFELIRSGKRFPDGYFWQTEIDRLQFHNGRTHNVSDSEAFLLMLGIFISRSLVTTILMKPIDYGLSSDALTDVAERNLRIVASTMLYLVRRVAIQRGRGIMEMPGEIAKYLYSDEEMQHVYGKLSRTFNYCEGLLREWSTEYIRRLRASAMQQPQQQER